MTAVSLPACGATVEPPAPVSLTISAVEAGSSLAARLGDAYSADNPHVSVTVTTATTPRTLEKLLAGNTDAALVSFLPPGADQFQQTPVARDGVAVIVHPDNPVENLTLLDLARIFSGQIYNWRDVQGSALEMQPVVRESDSGTRTIFNRRVMADERITPNARVFPNGHAVMAFVAQTPGAVGYVSATLVDDTVKVVSVEDVFPAADNLATGAYPLTHQLYLLTPPDAGAMVDDFAALFLSPAGQKIVTALGLGRVN